MTERGVVDSSVVRALDLSLNSTRVRTLKKRTQKWELFGMIGQTSARGPRLAVVSARRGHGERRPIHFTANQAKMKIALFLIKLD